MSNKKYPAFLFYPESWLADNKLSLCSYQTKGVWIDLICRMHQSEKYGYLYVSNRYLKKDDVQKMLKIADKKEFDEIWNELMVNEILKEDEFGFYSKKLIEENEKLIAKYKDKEDKERLAHYVLDEFDKITGKPNDYSRSSVLSRISYLLTKHEVDELLGVIKIKFKEWHDQPNMQQWINPSTFFGNKFPNYLIQLQEEIKNKQKEDKATKNAKRTFNYGDL